MKRKNTTRNALVSSIISLLLCVSMLVGATFAWFTDEVVSGMNTITAGNLDVELLANGTKVENTTKLFSNVEKWEPGVVAYENLQVVNEGTLALKYQMTLNFGDENNLNGHKLSEVLKVAVIDKIADNATRQDVLAAAKAAVAADKGLGSLSNFLQTGALAAKGKTAEIDGVTVTDKSDEMTVVIFWEPGTAEYDNQFNANNGQKTSDGEPLHIEFGINLQATQQMEEEDSFDETYDKLAANLPKATVNDLGAQTVGVTMNSWGGAAEQMELPFVLQFLPNETEDEARANSYRHYVADFVIKADRDVPAESMALAGYYKAFCGPDDGNGWTANINHGNWVALTAGETIPAGTEIRLVDALPGDIFVTYFNICEYGNDGIGFKCSAKDLTGANAGTTITVELRLYETTADPNNGTFDGVEVGPNAYEVVGTYTYTFPAAKATNNEELNAALAHGANAVDVAAGTYTFPASKLDEGVTLNCAPGTVFDGKTGLNINGATVVGATFTNDNDYLVNSTTINGTFKDCVFTDCDGLRYCYAGETVVFENCVFDTDFYGVHFDGGANEVIFKNCTFTGFNTFGNAVTKLTMEGCTFKYNGKGGYNGINLWGNSELINCTFVFDGSASNEWVDLCTGGITVTFTGCVVTDGTTETPIKDKVGNYGDGNTIIIDGVTVNIPNMS